MQIKRREYLYIFLSIILGVAIVTQIIPLMAAVLVAIFAVVLSFYNYFLALNKRIGFYICWLAAIILGIAVGLYRPSGFNYPLMFSVTQLYDGGSPMSLYLNTAKALAGYIIIYYLLSSNTSSSTYISSPLKQFTLVLILVALILSIACQLLGLEFHIKPLKYILIFGFVNLLVTCVAEEAFMRLLLQAQIQKFISGTVKQKIWQELIPLIIATTIFVLTHFVQGSNLIIVFALAGFSYALVYSLTKNIWACIAVHFGVNIIHFSFFTYPLVK